MPNDDYIAQGLTGEQIEAALEAIDGVVTPSNNGKVLYINGGKIAAKSASEWAEAPVLEPLTANANGDFLPPPGVDGFSSVHVAVPGAGNIVPLTATENGVYTAPEGVDGYAPVTVNVSSDEFLNIMGEFETSIQGGNSPSGTIDNGRVCVTKTGSYNGAYSFKTMIPASAEKLFVTIRSTDYSSPYNHDIKLYRASSYTKTTSGNLPSGSTLLVYLTNKNLTVDQIKNQERISNINITSNVSLPLQTVEIDISDLDDFYLYIQTGNQVMYLYNIIAV